ARAHPPPRPRGGRRPPAVPASPPGGPPAGAAPAPLVDGPSPPAARHAGPPLPRGWVRPLGWRRRWGDTPSRQGVAHAGTSAATPGLAGTPRVWPHDPPPQSS